MCKYYNIFMVCCQTVSQLLSIQWAYVYWDIRHILLASLFDKRCTNFVRHALSNNIKHVIRGSNC